MKFFHYLFENHPGEGVAARQNEKSVSLILPNLEMVATQYELPVDHRDQRALIVIDGELLWESIPKAGDVVLSSVLGDLITNVGHLRTVRFGEPSYRVEVEGERWVAKIELSRHFLLLPSGKAVFRRFRDRKSLGPMYTFVEVKKDDLGHSVVWRNSSY